MVDSRHVQKADRRDLNQTARLPGSAPDCEAELQRRYRDGDREGFAELLRRHHAALVRAAHWKSGGNREVAEEAWADAAMYLALPSTRERYDPTRPWLAWAMQVLTWKVIDVLRKRARDPAPAAQDASKDGEDMLHTIADPWGEEPLEFLLQEEISKAIRDCLEQLPRDEAWAVELSLLQGKTTDDTARLLGLPRATAAHRKLAGLTHLRDCLEAKGFGRD